MSNLLVSPEDAVLFRGYICRIYDAHADGETETERESSPRDMHASTQQFRPPVLAVQTPTDSREGLQQPPPSGHISPSPRCHMPALARRPEEGLLKELRPAAPHSASSVGGAIFSNVPWLPFGRASLPLLYRESRNKQGHMHRPCFLATASTTQVAHERERESEGDRDRERERDRGREKERERESSLPKRLPC